MEPSPTHPISRISNKNREKTYNQALRRAPEPLEEVFDFGRLAALQPGETRSLSFAVDVGVLASGRAPPAAAAPPGALFVYPGEYKVRIGDTRESNNFVSTSLVVKGTPTRVKS